MISSSQYFQIAVVVPSVLREIPEVMPEPVT